MFKPINSHLIISYVDLYEFIISISFSIFLISALCIYRYNCCFPQVFGKAMGKKHKIFKTWHDILYIFSLDLTHSSIILVQLKKFSLLNDAARESKFVQKGLL